MINLDESNTADVMELNKLFGSGLTSVDVCMSKQKSATTKNENIIATLAMNKTIIMKIIDEKTV